MSQSATLHVWQTSLACLRVYMSVARVQVATWCYSSRSSSIFSDWIDSHSLSPSFSSSTVSQHSPLSHSPVRARHRRRSTTESRGDRILPSLQFFSLPLPSLSLDVCTLKSSLRSGGARHAPSAWSRMKPQGKSKFNLKI